MMKSRNSLTVIQLNDSHAYFAITPRLLLPKRASRASTDATANIRLSEA
jgi:hypothetical protein